MKVGGGVLPVAVVAVSVLAAASGCGVSDGLDRLQETVDESLEESEPTSTLARSGSESDADDGWAEYTDEAGLFTVDLPSAPEYLETEQDGLTIVGWSSESNADGYGLSHFEIGPDLIYDFDIGVRGTVEGTVDSIGRQLGQPSTYEMVDQRSDRRNGHGGVRFTATVDVDEEPYATIRGAVYDTGDMIVLLTAVDTDSDNDAEAERFLDSLQLSS